MRQPLVRDEGRGRRGRRWRVGGRGGGAGLGVLDDLDDALDLAAGVLAAVVAAEDDGGGRVALVPPDLLAAVLAPAVAVVGHAHQVLVDEGGQHQPPRQGGARAREGGALGGVAGGEGAVELGPAREVVLLEGLVGLRLVGLRAGGAGALLGVLEGLALAGLVGGGGAVAEVGGGGVDGVVGVQVHVVEQRRADVALGDRLRAPQLVAVAREAGPADGAGARGAVAVGGLGGVAGRVGGEAERGAVGGGGGVEGEGGAEGGGGEVGGVERGAALGERESVRGFQLRRVIPEYGGRRFHPTMLLRPNQR